MKVLLACEESQIGCKAFREQGHEAYSCDIQDCSGHNPEYHIKDDIRNVLYREIWDLVIAHPVCTRLANCNVRWLWERNLWDELEEGIEFFNFFIDYGEKGNRIAIENPIQHKYARAKIRKYDQIIHPYMFGHMEQKATCLWLYELPKLVETNNVYEEMMKLPYKERAKVHWCSPGEERSKIRSKSYPGILEAMSIQWGQLCKNSLK